VKHDRRNADSALRPRRAQSNRYPDLGPENLAPAFPVLVGPVAVGVCSPLQWRNRPRFSRGSLTLDCDEDGQQVHRFQRTVLFYTPRGVLPRENFANLCVTGQVNLKRAATWERGRLVRVSQIRTTRTRRPRSQAAILPDNRSNSCLMGTPLATVAP
jgi:hypothetical protein